MEADSPEDIKNMLNNMKVMEFREKQQEKAISQFFMVWKSSMDDRSKRQYNRSLYCKVFKSLMQSGIQLDKFAERLENVYINMLLKNHFEAFKEFKSIRQVQTQQKINQVRINRKLINGTILVNNLKRMITQKIRKQAKEKEISNQTAIKYKTDQQFYRPNLKESRSIHQPTRLTQNCFGKPLADSRKSAQSSSSMASDFTGKRKFAAVKLLPKMPILQSVIEQQVPSSNIVRKDVQKSKVISQEHPQPTQKLQQQYMLEQKPDHNEEIQAINKKQIPQKGQPCAYNKEKILSLICQIKMIQIKQLTSIVDQYSSSLKYQSIITQKNYLSQSISTLNNIIAS